MPDETVSAQLKTITILNRWSGAVLWTGTADSLRQATEQAVKSRADLTGARLTGARLTGARLTGADLTGARLTGADLTGADLTGARLTGADLTGARLTPIRDDFWAVLSAAAAEVPALREAVISGKIDGSQYEGQCACLVGTIANSAHCPHNALPNLRPNSSRPAERFFLMIRPGHTPANHPPSKIVLDWIDTWLDGVRKLAAVLATEQA